jgi:hypothetical protein
MDRQQEVRRWRDHLSALAGVQFHPRLRARMGLSSVAQQTMLEAYQKRPHSRAERPAQELA